MTQRLRNGFRICFILTLFASFTVIQAQTLSSSDAGALLHQFVQAQKAQMQDLTSRNRTALKEFKKAQELHWREWEKNEKDARHRFFEEHPKGAERRVYVHDFIQRRETLKKQMAEDRKTKSQAYESEMKKLQEDHSTRLNSFKESLQKGEEPAKELWPVSQ